MARTDATKVGKVIEVDPTITDLTPFIDAANELVTELCEPEGYSEPRLTMIETWLAAHFYAVRDPRSTNEAAGSVSAAFESKVDLALNITRYGQQAMLLDTAGALASLNQQTVDTGGSSPRAFGVSWGGTDLETNY